MPTRPQLYLCFLLIIFGGLLSTCKGNALGQEFIVSYKVLTSSQVNALYTSSKQSDNSKSPNNNEELYAFGYIQTSPSYKGAGVMAELTFFNPAKKAFVKSTNLGWIWSTKKYFLIHLGSRYQFSNIEYSTKVLMRK